jgi:hypothetical protein
MVARILPILTAIFLCGGSLAQASERLLGGTSAEALRIARDRQAHWTLGQLGIRHKWFGPPRVRAELLDDGRVVARLRVDPATGGFLARHERPTGGGDVRDLDALRSAVERALHRLEIGDWTWPTEQGRAWGVPLRYGDRVVGTLKVDVRQGLLARTDED